MRATGEKFGFQFLSLEPADEEELDSNILSQRVSIGSDRGSAAPYSHR